MLPDAGDLVSGRCGKHASAPEGRRGAEGAPSRSAEGIEKECGEKSPLTGPQFLLTHSWSSPQLPGGRAGCGVREVGCDL